MKLSGNKGEWSELYVLIKLLAEGKIYSAKENLQKNEKCWFPILKIFRDENRLHHVEYVKSEKNQVELYLNNVFVSKIETSELEFYAQKFFDEITANTGAFEIDGSENIMRTLRCTKIRADSSDKTDIKMEIHDPFTNFERICGFSIKSDLGSSPTLFNASKSTNFKFEVFGIDDSEMEELNAINTRTKIIDRMNRIEKLNFVSVINKTFSKNLMFIDTQMEKFLAEMLKIFYKENISDCAELVKLLDSTDPLNFNIENIYKHKLKKFLCAVALGLMPTRKWDGLDEANGGYIIVKESGEVLAYHLHDRDSFENYLLNNTKLEKGSTDKHNFGKIYIEDGRKFINLNLQVRFK